MFQAKSPSHTKNTLMLYGQMLGKRHITGRRPGYTYQARRDEAKKQVEERDQFDGDKDMLSALFDYTIYPAALMRKDATLKAARARDGVLTKDAKEDVAAPLTVKSS